MISKTSKTLKGNLIMYFRQSLLMKWVSRNYQLLIWDTKIQSTLPFRSGYSWDIANRSRLLLTGLRIELLGRSALIQRTWVVQSHGTLTLLLIACCGIILPPNKNRRHFWKICWIKRHRPRLCWRGSRLTPSWTHSSVTIEMEITETRMIALSKWLTASIKTFGKSLAAPGKRHSSMMAVRVISERSH